MRTSSLLASSSPLHTFCSHLQRARLAGTEHELVATGLADVAATALAETRWVPTGHDPLAAHGDATGRGKCPFGFGGDEGAPGPVVTTGNAPAAPAAREGKCPFGFGA